jgi:hypothetical protein
MYATAQKNVKKKPKKINHIERTQRFLTEHNKFLPLLPPFYITFLMWQLSVQFLNCLNQDVDNV